MEQQIRRLEEVIGDYKHQRQTPLIKRNTWLNRYVEEAKYVNFNPLRYIPAFFTSFFYRNDMSLYRRKSNVILMQTQKSKDDSSPDLGFYHEMGHSMLDEIKPAGSPPYRKVSRVVRNNLFYRRITRDKLEKAFIQHAITEGTCEYLSIEAQKLEVEEGRNPEEVYCYTREQNLVKFRPLGFDKPKKEEKKAIKPTPLSRKKAEVIEDILNKGIEVIPRLYKRWLPLRLLDGLYVTSFIETLARISGYYLARSSCEAHPELSKKQVFQSLFKNPPENIHQFQQRIIDNIAQAQKITEIK